MNAILSQIRAELKASVDAKTQASFQRFFKEPVKAYGVKTATVEKIGAKYWKEIAHLPKAEIFTLCEDLYKSDYMEEAFIVSGWAPRLTVQFQPGDLSLFYRWIDVYINNWAKCDGFCNHTMGNFFEKFPELLPELEKWAKTKNRWVKRAAAVSLIVPAKRGKYLENAFRIADILLTDKDDMVQKGYGWLLKEESRLHQKEVFDYVVKNKKVMPRTALRYAIELMPPEMRQEAMKKD
ncbi:MAG: DNA alkylation repair protein [Dehalococcoidales bacterium]|nr:DNA alkylation repair protein [Dehalococcoidales bacterium]